MKKLLLLLLFSMVNFLALSESVKIQNPVYVKSKKGDWKKESFRNKDFTLNYQLYSPKDTGKDKLPLIIYLHGSGEAGDDNRIIDWSFSIAIELVNIGD